jgi:hypothetical protein
MEYFHLAGQILAIGSVIAPGNWGRIIRQIGWQHNLAIREMALEDVRATHFQNLPSRLESVFVFLTIQGADQFRASVPGFQFHLLYRVSLLRSDVITFTTDWRLVNPQGALRAGWANAYWQGVNDAGIAGPIPGMDWSSTTGNSLSREVLALSEIRIEERVE